MANWSLPAISDLYANVLAYINAKLSDVAMMLDSATTTPTNLPTGAKRWNSSSNKWEKWSGSAWSDMASLYGISISGNAATASNAASCSGNAATASNAAQLGGYSAAYFQPALGFTPLNKAGDVMTGDLRLANVGNPATGNLQFGDTGSKYLYYNGSSFVLTGPLTINGDTALRNGDVAAANSAPVKTALNAGGSAPIYACRAWCTFTVSGGVPGALVGGNVSGITDNGSGDFTINFATAMPDANYAASVLGKEYNSTSASFGAGKLSGQTVANTFNAAWIRVSGGSLGTTGSGDPVWMSVSIFR